MKVGKQRIPPIKCQGIKTKLVHLIGGLVPTDVSGTWVEPFMGSGVVAFNMRPRRAVLADTNPHIIEFYKAIRDQRITALSVRAFLEAEGEKLRRTNGAHYYQVRERFNDTGEPLDFLFLNRACFNGLIRYNRGGGFNVPFCRKPNRFSKGLITKIVNQVHAASQAIGSGDYEFLVQPYMETIHSAKAGDFIYCDPPYIGRHSDYYSQWHVTNEMELAKLLATVPCKFILSTWHHNQFRQNEFIDSLWSQYNIITRKHFYHVGAQEVNRNPMVEALVTNYPIDRNVHASLGEQHTELNYPKEIERGMNDDGAVQVKPAQLL